MNWINVTIFSPNWEPLSFWEFILLATSIILFLGFILSVAFILWGWLLLILSWGKEEKTKPAINTIRYAVLWIFITVWAVFLAPILGWLLWMKPLVEEYFSPNAIYDKVTSIATNLFWGNTNVWTSTRYIDSKWNSDDLGDIDF